jgi:hypothetical protein
VACDRCPAWSDGPPWRMCSSGSPGDRWRTDDRGRDCSLYRSGAARVAGHAARCRGAVDLVPA